MMIGPLPIPQAGQPSPTIDIMRAISNPLFRFVVAIDYAFVAAFTECDLPTIEWEMFEVQEGGLNTHIHSLPGRRKKATLTLHNGIGLGEILSLWYSECLNERFTKRRITVALMSAPGVPIMIWFIEDCMPVKWIGPQLKSGENTIAIQKLELNCGQITCEPWNL